MQNAHLVEKNAHLDANLEKPYNFWTNGPIFKIQSSKMVRISPEFAMKPHSGDRMAHLAITFVRELWQIFTPACQLCQVW